MRSNLASISRFTPQIAQSEDYAYALKVLAETFPKDHRAAWKAFYEGDSTTTFYGGGYALPVKATITQHWAEVMWSFVERGLAPTPEQVGADPANIRRMMTISHVWEAGAKSPANLHVICDMSDRRRHGWGVKDIAAYHRNSHFTAWKAFYEGDTTTTFYGGSHFDHHQTVTGLWCETMQALLDKGLAPTPERVGADPANICRTFPSPNILAAGAASEDNLQRISDAHWRQRHEWGLRDLTQYGFHRRDYVKMWKAFYEGDTKTTFYGGSLLGLGQTATHVWAELMQETMNEGRAPSPAHVGGDLMKVSDAILRSFGLFNLLRQRKETHYAELDRRLTQLSSDLVTATARFNARRAA